MNEQYTPWGSTKYGPIKIPIFSAPRKEIECDAYTSWHHGIAYICVADEVVANPKRLDATLTHEFVHVVEYMNDAGWLSPTKEDSCTLLAQTMEVGLTQLLRNLKQVGMDARRGTSSKRRNASGKKARTSRPSKTARG